jgi:ubiquinone/menaquinone biosynthesis C-methylase UbiE
MAMPTNSYQERHGTYVVQDRSNPHELKRLQIQDHLITVAQGGVLPEYAEPARLTHVLDVACGLGGWLIELARTVPTISHLVGVDISKQMIEIARAEAAARHVQNRVTFHIMDALHLFDLPDDHFDLVNMGFAVSFLRVWEWPRVLLELRRVAQSGGVIRLTEADLPDQSSSPALLRLFHLLTRAYSQAGRYFYAQANGVASDLTGLLQQCKLHSVQTRTCRSEIRGDTVAGQLFCENVKYLFRTNVPFLQKWIRMPDDYEDLYQQMLEEVQRPDFAVSSLTVTAWGSKP